jgi:hypothetical protein
MNHGSNDEWVTHILQTRHHCSIWPKFWPENW